MPAGDVVAELDFASAEAAWSGLHVDAQGNLKIDGLTESALTEAIALVYGQTSMGQTFVDQSSGPSSARMALLLEKQFGATASRQVMELLPLLKQYKGAEQRWWEENGSKNPPPHAELFQLQDELLGKARAEELFSKQRRLVEVMLASQRIRDDSRLSQMEKERALTDLQKTLHDPGTTVE